MAGRQPTGGRGGSAGRGGAPRGGSGNSGGRGRSGGSAGGGPRGSSSSGGARGGAGSGGGGGRGRPSGGGDSRGGDSRGGRGGPAGRGARDTSARQFSSRGAGRTGRITEPGARKTVEKSLGGEQVEGRQAVRELLVAGKRRVKEIWLAGDLDPNDVVDDIIEIARSMRVQVTEVNRKRLESQARSEAPQGVIAFAAPLEDVELDLLLRRRPNDPPFLVALDGVTDPGNLGALLRCCDGAGVHGVVLPRHRAVHVTPTAAKAAAGAVEHVPMAMVGGLPAALARIKDAGIWVIGLDDAADRSLFEIEDLAKEGICLVMGAEGAGLSRLVRERCDMIVSIPMKGRLSSLNVSAAAALAVYEVTRHRV
jgi:23S rRNA (guanosine2251-2'-O)-methyltransferase